MYKEGKAQRNAEGKIVQAASFQSRDIPTAVIEPNRKWFTNTRVISQDTLKSFREAVAEKDKDPYQVLLKSNKLPMSLIRDGQDVNGLKQHQAKMTIESQPFAEVFGPKAQRKRVKLGSTTISDLAEDTEKSLDKHVERLEQIKLLSGQSSIGLDGADGVEAEEDFSIATAKEPIFNKGQSKRIWNELYKVIDSSGKIRLLLPPVERVPSLTFTQTLSSMSSMPEIHWALGVGVLRNISGKRHHTSTSSSSSTRRTWCRPV